MSQAQFFDLSGEGEQQEMQFGPVPGGSVVVVELEILKHQEEPDPYIFTAQSGLRQLSCRCHVINGTYKGVMWRQNITLPAVSQNIALTQGQQRACNIGGAQLKAICIASNRPLRMAHPREISGARFPVKVRINRRPYEKDGKVYWNNEIAVVITPDMQEYVAIRRSGEIIVPDGPVVGDGYNPVHTAQSQTQTDFADPFPSEQQIQAAQQVDPVPF